MFCPVNDSGHWLQKCQDHVNSVRKLLLQGFRKSPKINGLYFQVRASKVFHYLLSNDCIYTTVFKHVKDRVSTERICFYICFNSPKSNKIFIICDLRKTVCFNIV